MSDEAQSSYFAQEIREQPAAIRSSLADSKASRAQLIDRAQQIEHVFLTGSGDSFFLGYAAVAAFVQLAGLPAEVIEAYDFTLTRGPLLGPTAVVIGISASGKALLTKAAVDLATQAGAFTASLTNKAESPLAQAAHIAMPTTAGISYTFPTKTTTTALAVLVALAADLGAARGRLSANDHADIMRELNSSVPEAIEQRLNTEQDIAAAARLLVNRRQIIFVGSGAYRSAAMIGAAKLYETCHRHASAINAEEYLHLVGFAVRPDDAVVIIADGLTGRERQVAEYAAKQGAAIILLCPAEVGKRWPVEAAQITIPISGLMPWSGTLVAMVSLHLLAHSCSLLEGTNPDRPEGIDLQYVLDLLYSSPLEGWT